VRVRFYGGDYQGFPDVIEEARIVRDCKNERQEKIVITFRHACEPAGRVWHTAQAGVGGSGLEFAPLKGLEINACVEGQGSEVEWYVG
jgi:hypothetical protein